MTQSRETRMGKPIELRADSDGSVVVEGYAAVFNEPTDIGGVFTEMIAPGAFRSALDRKDDVEFLVNHGGLPLARSTAGNLTMSEDEHGLKIRAELDPEDPDVQRILPKMRKRGMLDQMSFAFQATEQDWSETDTGDVRTVKDVVLYDVSIVNRGAYPQTEIALRAHQDAKAAEEEKQREAEKARRRWSERQAEQEQKFRKI